MFRKYYFGVCIATANMLPIASGIVLSWSMRCHSEEFIAKWTRTWLYAVLPLGAAPACLLSTYAGFRFGRRTSLLVVGVLPLAVSTLVHAVATCHLPPRWHLVARALAAAAVGAAATQVPVYVRELCAAANRDHDALPHSPRVSVAFGHCLCYAMAAISSMSASASVALNMAAVAAMVGVSVLLACCLPETPQFLIAAKRELRAKDVLIRLKNSTLVDTDFRFLCERSQRTSAHRAIGDWRALARTALFGAVLMQASSLRVLCFFASDVFVYMRIVQQQQPAVSGAVQLAIVGLVQLLVTAVLVRFAGRFSRRAVLLSSLGALLLGAHLPLAYFFRTLSAEGGALMRAQRVSSAPIEPTSVLPGWIPAAGFSVAFVGHHLVGCAIDLIAADIDLDDRRLHHWTVAAGEALSWLLCGGCALALSLLEADVGIYTRDWAYAGRNCLWMWFALCGLVTLVAMLLVKFGFVNCKLLMPPRS